MMILNQKKKNQKKVINIINYINNIICLYFYINKNKIYNIIK